MLKTNNINLQQKLQKLSRRLILCVLLIAVFVLAGWQLDIEFLKRPIPGLAAMNPLTAFAFLFIAVSFLLITAKSKTQLKSNSALILASIVLCIGLLKISALLFGYESPLDGLLFSGKFNANAGGNSFNRIAPNTAFCLILSAISLMAINFETRRGRVPSQYFALTIAVICWLSVLGYIYRVPEFYEMLSYVPMAIHTALCFILIALAILLIHPDKGLMSEFTSPFAGSIAARLLVPMAVILPTIIGLLRLYGHWEQAFSIEMGATLMVLFIIIIFLAAILYCVVLLNRRDAEAKKSQQQINYLAGLIEQTSDAIFSLDANKCIISWNKAAELMYGYTKEEVTGKQGLSITKADYTEWQLEEMGRQLNEKGYWIGDAVHKNKKGGSIPVISSLSVIKDESNISSGYVLVVRDISERKKLEEELRNLNANLEKQVQEKTAELQNIFERITDAFIALDKNFCYTYVNKKTGELLHRDPQSLIGKNVWDEFPEAVGSATFHAFNTAMETQQFINHIDYYAPLNLWQENFIYPSPDGLSVFIRNITEKKRTEEQLLQERNLLRTVIDNIPDYIYVKDTRFRHIINNLANVKLLGALSEEETLGKTVWDYFKPELAGKYIEDDKRVLENGSPVVNREEMIVSHSGEVRWLLTSKIPLKNINNELIGLVGVSRDITERKKTENALTESENRLRAIFQTEPECVKLLGAGCEVLQMNPAGLAMIEADNMEQVLGHSVINIVEPAYREAFEELTSNVFKGISGSLQFEIKGLKGSHRWLETHAVPLKDTSGNIISLLGVTRDITAGKINEQKIISANERFKMVARATNDAVWDYNVTSDEIWWNEKHYQLYGRNPSEPPLRVGAWADRIHPDERDNILKQYNRVFDDNKDSWEFEYRFRLPDGNYINAYDRGYVQYSGKKPIRIVGSVADVTMLKKAEQEIKETTEQLRQLSAHLQEVREEERKHLAREVHDELGQLLTTSKLGIFWLSKRIPAGEQSLHEKLNEITAILDNTIKIVRKIATELRPGLLDDLGLVAAIDWQSQEFEKKTGITVSFFPPSGEYKIPDPVATGLFRIYQESLTNIARHADATKVEVTLCIEDTFMRLEIKDNGRGFDTSIAGQKKTLGLLGMKERVLMMGGHYEINSKLGEGTVVQVYCPFSGNRQ